MIDYKKLFEMCIESWLECEGVCWRPDDDAKNLTPEEIKAAQEIVDRLDPD